MSGDWRSRYRDAMRRSLAASSGSSATTGPVASDAGIDDSDGDDPAISPDDLSAVEAGRELYEYLVEMKLSNRTFSARAVCTIAFLSFWPTTLPIAMATTHATLTERSACRMCLLLSALMPSQCPPIGEEYSGVVRKLIVPPSHSNAWKLK